MKNISLSKVSVMVLAAITSSFLVNANDSTIANESIPEKAVVEQSEQKLAKLAFNTLDKDKNGLLSQEEIGDSKNQILEQSFNKIDSNKDLSLSQEELAAYIVAANK